MLARRTAAALSATTLALAGLTATASALESSDVAPDRVLNDVSDGALQRGLDVADDGRLFAATDDGRIRVFAPGAAGDDAPERTISGPSTQLVDLANVAVGDADRIHVVTTIDPIKVLVFAPGASGNATPERVITGPSTELEDPKSLTVGPDGSIYVVCDDEGFDGRVLVFAPGADGDAAPARVITGAKTGLVSPEDAAVDDAGRLHVTEWNPGFVNVYAPDASGNAEPERTISLSNPELWQSTRLDIDDEGNVYVGGYSGDRVFVFPSDAEGDDEPLIVLQGDESRIDQPWNIAVDAESTIYVGNYGSDDVTVYESLDKPSRVRDLVITGKAKAKEWKVSWTAPTDDGGRPVTGYQVTIHAGDKKTHSYRVTGTTTTIGRKHTRSGAHRVSVAARNVVGAGDARSKAFTVAKIKPAEVRGVVVKRKPTAAKRVVRWKAPAWTGGARITNYRVVIKRGDAVVAKVLRKGKARKVVLRKDDLRRGRLVAQVRAKNVKGWGPKGVDAFRVR